MNRSYPLDFRVQFTPLAYAFSIAKSSLVVVEGKARQEIRELSSGGMGGGTEGRSSEDGFKKLTDLIYTAFKVGDLQFICYPIDEKTLEIDTATVEEEDDKLAGGPFKGYKLLVPRGDSERGGF
jgi:hypothetical protein